MAMGCAVVTTRTGLGGDLVNGKEALVCDAGDRDDLKNKIEALINDEDLRQRIANAGWERVRSMTWNNAAKSLEAFYLAWTEEWKAGRALSQ
jgi:glycosyltransferase involved in cell wall biosynthesis